MNYYESTLEKINSLIENEKIDEAMDIIQEELKAPYLPKKFEETIKKIYMDYKPQKYGFRLELSDEDVMEYLKGSSEKQLVAIDQLDKRNLRDYIDICNEYLCSEDAMINAKVLLIDSLIRQEIGEEMKMINEGMEYSFIPKYIVPVTESEGYVAARDYLNDFYMKDPSKARMAVNLLYSQVIMALPLNVNKEEGIYLAEKIVEYIDGSFEA